MGNDYRIAFKAACADLGAISALLGFEAYPGVDALLRSITELLAAHSAGRSLPLRNEQKAALDLAVLNLKTHGDDQLLSAVTPLIEYYKSTAHSAGAQGEPVRWEIREQYDDGHWSEWMICSKKSADHYRQFPHKEIRALYAQPQPMPQMDAARNMKRWRERIIQTMRAPGNGETVRTLNGIVREMTDEIEPLGRAKGE